MLKQFRRRPSRKIVKWALVLAIVFGGWAYLSTPADGQVAGVWDSVTKIFGWQKNSGDEIKSVGNGAPNGKHYNLNIIATKDKNATMTDTSGKSLFIPLSGKCRVDLRAGDFQVLDRNCTDGPAVFQLPDPDPDGDGVTAYSVYARALGRAGKLKATSCTTDMNNETWCSTEQVVLVRDTGKSKFQNFSQEFLSVCIDTDGDTICDTRAFLFDDALSDYFWELDQDPTNPLRHAQLRFYEVETNVGLNP